jgi:hypothetical protein
MKVRRFHNKFAIRSILDINPYFMPVLVFGAYWGVTLLLLLVSGYNSESKQGGLFLHFIKLLTLYFNDVTHFVFSIIISISTLPISLILNKSRSVVKHTTNCLALESDQELFIARYNKCFEIAYSWPVIVFCLTLATSAFLIVVIKATNDTYVYWWGHLSHGISGFYFAFISSQMVFWGALSFFVIGAQSNVFFYIRQLKLKYKPLNVDGCNGLRPLGFLILLMWTYSLCVAIAIYIVFTQGYLGLENNPIIWTLAILASINIPIIAIAPLFSATRAVHAAKELHLQRIERSLHRHGLDGQAHQHDHLNVLLDIRRKVLEENIFPFNSRAFIIFASLNAVQFAASVRELLMN